MRKRCIVLLALACVLCLLNGCIWVKKTSDRAPAASRIETQKPADLGTEKSKSSCESKAKSYCKDQFKTTYGGYKITKYNFGSCKYLGQDEYYYKFSISGNYTFTNKYGKSENKNFTMNVKVYRWSKNPYNKNEVTYY